MPLLPNIVGVVEFDQALYDSTSLCFISEQIMVLLQHSVVDAEQSRLVVNIP